MKDVYCSLLESLALIQICVTIIYVGQRDRKGGSCHYPFWILFVVCTTCLLQITGANGSKALLTNFEVLTRKFFK